MTGAEAQLIINIISLVINRGVPAFMTVMENWKKQDPTMQDFKLLQDMMKHPDDF